MCVCRDRSKLLMDNCYRLSFATIKCKFNDNYFVNVLLFCIITITSTATYSDDVDPAKDCYWVTSDYYQTAVEYISSTVELSTTHSITIPSTTTVHSENDLLSEYSASYV